MKKFEITGTIPEDHESNLNIQPEFNFDYFDIFEDSFPYNDDELLPSEYIDEVLFDTSLQKISLIERESTIISPNNANENISTDTELFNKTPKTNTEGRK